MIKQILILAGGLGKRLRKLGYKSPKYLIQIGRKKFADYQLLKLKNNRLKNFVICTGHKSTLIKRYLKRAKKFNLKINYSNEKKSLGTGGAIKNAIKKDLVDEFFFLIYGDTFPLINFSQVSKSFFKHKKPILMTILKNNNRYDKSNIGVRNNKIIIYSKKKENLKYIDYGVLVINKKYFITKSGNNYKFDLSQIITKAVKEKKISTHIVKKRFYEIGSEEGIMEFKKYVKKNNIYM